MSTTPRFSVIMPAHQAEALLPDTLGALLASTLPRSEWELIVVDDASPDSTSAVAASLADHVITLAGKPLGPGGARNAALATARGAWLIFIDSDVRVHPDTLQRIADAVARDPGLVALFGSYDRQPDARGVLSEYRNLLHRYVHLRGAGEAETFWAGCGAVRRDAFEAIGGFDTVRFPRPQIEDIELGYRLRDRGGRILLDPDIQGTHLKRWRLGAMLRTDFRDRGLPWMRLLLERRGHTAPTLNTGRAEQFRVACAGVGLAALVAALVLRNGVLGIIGVLLFGALTIANLDTYRWFAAERGVGFAVLVVPLHLAYYVSNALAAALGIAQYIIAPTRSVSRAA
ncbi:MAG: glycosyltransferase family 2 protein [Gemmatimonadota bacterium]